MLTGGALLKNGGVAATGPFRAIIARCESR